MDALLPPTLDDEGTAGQQSTDVAPLTFASKAPTSIQRTDEASFSSPLRRSTRQASHAASTSITQSSVAHNGIRAHFAAVTSSSSSSLALSSAPSATPALTPSLSPSALPALIAQPQQLTCADLFRFQSPAKPDTVIVTPDHCRIYFVRSFLSPLAVSLLRSFLDSLIDWQSGTLYGNPLPRVSMWFGGEPYKYAAKRWPHFPHPPFLLHIQALLTAHLRQTVDAQCGQLTTCLVNKYRGGSDSMGRHSDDEAELGPEPSIASLNIGQARTFCMARRDAPSGGGRRQTVKFELTEGSLLLMSGRTQEKYVHWVPKQRDRDGVRYNLTFRPWVGSQGVIESKGEADN